MAGLRAGYLVLLAAALGQLPSDTALPCPVADTGLRSRTSVGCGLVLNVVNETPQPVDVLWVGIDGFELRSFTLGAAAGSGSTATATASEGTAGAARRRQRGKQSVCTGQVWRARLAAAAGAAGERSVERLQYRRLLAELRIDNASALPAQWRIAPGEPARGL